MRTIIIDNMSIIITNKNNASDNITAYVSPEDRTDEHFASSYPGDLEE